MKLTSDKRRLKASITDASLIFLVLAGLGMVSGSNPINWFSVGASVFFGIVNYKYLYYEIGENK